MSLDMYQASIPAFRQTLDALTAMMDKAIAYAEAKKIDPSVLVQARLFPDMFPFSRQIQIAADFAKSGPARLAGVEVPKYEDNETSFPELKARIAKTAAFMTALDRATIEASADRDITLTIGGNPLHFKGAHYLVHFVMPNFYFHATTAYDILRMNGVELGKRDFMGNFLPG